MVGKGTEILSHLKKGDSLEVLGPCGNGFDLREEGAKMLLVGGGVGIPPLYHLTENFLKNKIKKNNIHIFLGARNKSLLLCEKDFKRLGVNLHLATDDGSKGKKGFITEILENFLSSNLSPLTSSRLFTCGPTPMMKAVTVLATQYKVPSEVSVEVPMACGFGACLGCAVKVRDKNHAGHRHAIACCEGPVFSGKEILWD